MLLFWTYLWFCALDDAAGLGLANHLRLLGFHRWRGLGLGSRLLRSRGLLGCSLGSSLLRSRGFLGGGGLLWSSLLGGGGGGLLWRSCFLLGLWFGGLGGSDGGLLLTRLLELYWTGSTLWLLEDVALNTGLEGLGQVRGECIVGSGSKAVVGLNVLLDGLSAVEEITSAG
jgi:hypothetical protein